MIKSWNTALNILKNGGQIERGCHDGYWIRSGVTGDRKRISPKTVRDMDSLLIRTDDNTSKVGETWALKP